MGSPATSANGQGLNIGSELIEDVNLEGNSFNNMAEHGNQNDDANSEINITGMIQNLDGNLGRAESPPPMEIQDALVDIEQPLNYGDNLEKSLAEGFIKTVSRPLSKESKEKLKNNIIIPSNCKVISPPKMNPEVWMALPSKSRLSDLQAQQVQQSLSLGIVSFATISNEIAKLSVLPVELRAKLVKQAMNAANLLGSQFQDLNQSRRIKLKPHLPPDCTSLCNSQVPLSDLLFGDNFSEKVKSAKTAANLMRTPQQSGQRFRPYPQRPAVPLNYHRPSQTYRGRWNGSNYRGHQSQRHQSPYNQTQGPFQNQSMSRFRK